MPEITQIAACEFTSGEIFSQYVLPTTRISPDAERVTGIQVAGDGMTVNGEKVECVQLAVAVDKFCQFVRKYPQTILIAHNGRRFDFPVFIANLLSVDKLDGFYECCAGMIDSLSVFRKLYPKESLKQEHLVAKLLGINYNAHNASADVKALTQLMQHTQLSAQELLKHSYPPVDIHNSMIFNKEKEKNLPTLSCLVSSGVCKLCTAENIAGSGLNLAHLRKICQRSGEDGLRDSFTMKNCEGLPRVTNNKKVLEEVIPKLADYLVK